MTVFAKIMALLPVLALLAAASQPAPLRDDDRHQMRCAAAFAIVATAQAQAEPAALALPPLGIRGQRYFGLVGERIAAQSGLSGAAMRDRFIATAQEVAKQGAIALARSCLADLDAAVPAPPPRDALQCHALLGAYADVLTRRDPASALAVTLAGESAALAPAAKALLRSRGVDETVLPARMAQVRNETARTLAGQGPVGDGRVFDADDFAQCRALARVTPG